MILLLPCKFNNCIYIYIYIYIATLSPLYQCRVLFVGAHIVVQFSSFSYRSDIIVHAVLALLLALIDLLANRVKEDLGLVSPQSLHMQALLSSILSGHNSTPTNVGVEGEDDGSVYSPLDNNNGTMRQSLEGLLPRTSFTDMTASTLNHPLSNCDSLYYRRNPTGMSSRNSFTTNPNVAVGTVNGNKNANQDDTLTPLLGNVDASNIV